MPAFPVFYNVCNLSRELIILLKGQHEKKWILEQAFEKEKYPNKSEMYALSYRTGLSYKSVQNWFINKRYAIKRKQKEAAAMTNVLPGPPNKYIDPLNPPTSTITICNPQPPQQ